MSAHEIDELLKKMSKPLLVIVTPTYNVLVGPIK